MRWLAQITSEIIRTVGWEKDFACEGVANLGELAAVVNELDSLDPVPRAVHSDTDGRAQLGQFYRAPMLSNSPKMDSLLDLLSVTADALAATWNQSVEVSGKISGRRTIQ
jgi:hypothetical protein